MFKHHFNAMGCPCEIIIDNKDILLQNLIINDIKKEVTRLENKYSYYKQDSFINRLNLNKKAKLDKETYELLNLANQAYLLSNNLFDITSGSLKSIWNFNHKNFEVPTKSIVKKALQNIGFNKVIYNQTEVILPPYFTIDLGGLVKEYAVDSSITIVNEKYQIPILVNLGGDIRVSNTPPQNPWQIGIENTNTIHPPININLLQGAIATSGNTHRFFIKNNKKYCHIINPKTGYPVKNPPQSVTVIYNNCTLAGILTTIAILYEQEAEDFLKAQKVKYHIIP
jgi:thiamine biosynthesis lipoprotein